MQKQNFNNASFQEKKYQFKLKIQLKALEAIDVKNNANYYHRFMVNLLESIIITRQKHSEKDIKEKLEM